MPTTINNEASTTFQFDGSGEINSLTSNVNSVVLEDSQGLVLTKTASPTEFLAGDIITYTINITNTSASFLTGVRIIDNLGGGNLAYVLGSATLTTLSQTYPVTPIATNPLTFTLQQLGVGASMTLTYRAQVIFNLPQSVSSITNSVQGIGYTSTGTVTGYTSRTIQKKNSSVDFSFTKTATETNVYPNQLFTYRLTYVNESSNLGRVISITDQLASSFVITSIIYRVNGGVPVTLSPSEYELQLGNILVVTPTSGELVVPADGTMIVDINGYFN
jgi:uncharacterized repeat protein (TIGR01451 family)